MLDYSKIDNILNAAALDLLEARRTLASVMNKEDGEEKYDRLDDAATDLSTVAEVISSIAEDVSKELSRLEDEGVVEPL